MRYRACGASGPLVVLVHGFGASADQWPGHAALAASGHRVFAVDLLGFGYSSKPDPMGLPPNTVYNFATWGSQLADFVAHVGAGEPAFFVANSVGGVAALQAAVDAPGLVRGVVLLSVSLRGLHVTKQPPALRPLVAAFQRLLRTTPLGPALFAQIAQRDAVRSVLLQAFAVKAAVTDELVDAILAPAFLPGAAAVFLDFVSNSYGPLAEDLLPCCACPVLTVWGEEDPWELASLARGLYTPEAVPGVVERFVALPGVGHCPQSEAPDRVNGLVVDFVARHHAAARAAAAAATGGAPPPSLPAGV